MEIKNKKKAIDDEMKSALIIFLDIENIIDWNIYISRISVWKRNKEKMLRKKKLNHTELLIKQNMTNQMFSTKGW